MTEIPDALEVLQSESAAVQPGRKALSKPIAAFVSSQNNVSQTAQSTRKPREAAFKTKA